MERSLLALVVILSCSLAVAQDKPAQGAKPADFTQVIMEVTQLKVNLTRLRSQGIEWKITAQPEDQRNARTILTMARATRDALTIEASPIITTIAGHEANFRSGSTRLNLLPNIRGEEIEVAVSLNVHDPATPEVLAKDHNAQGPVRSSISSVVKCRAGETRLLRATSEFQPNKQGDAEEIVTMVFILTDTELTDQFHNITPNSATKKARLLR